MKLQTLKTIKNNYAAMVNVKSVSKSWNHLANETI